MERLQSQALRAASKWLIKRSNKEMLKELKIVSVLDHHKRISRNYIKRGDNWFAQQVIQKQTTLFALTKLHSIV